MPEPDISAHIEKKRQFDNVDVFVGIPDKNSKSVLTKTRLRAKIFCIRCIRRFVMEQSAIYKRALEVMEDNFGHMTIMSLGTCADNVVAVRDLHAYYHNGKMYLLAKTNNTLMHDIAKNPNVGLCHSAHNMQGVARSLGHPLEPQNADLRKRLKKEFSLNYDEYVTEDNPEMRIVEITLIRAETFTRYHRYEISFAEGAASRDHTEPYLLYR